MTLILVLLAMSATVATAIPAWPSSFYGTVKVDGANVPVGTKVSAWINGVQYAEAAGSIYADDTVYSLDVPGDDPGSPSTLEGGRTGDTIVFYVGDRVADQTAVWQSGTNVRLNLTTSIGNAPAPTLTPSPTNPPPTAIPPTSIRTPTTLPSSEPTSAPQAATSATKATSTAFGSLATATTTWPAPTQASSPGRPATSVTPFLEATSAAKSSILPPTSTVLPLRSVEAYAPPTVTAAADAPMTSPPASHSIESSVAVGAVLLVVVMGLMFIAARRRK